MGQPDKELRLRSVIDRISRVTPHADDSGQIQRRYDVCLIDCSPSIGLLSYNAIAAGREVIIPVETSFFSLKGAAKQVQTVRSIARRVGMRLNPRVLATMHDPNQPLARDLLEDLRERFGSALIPLVIRHDQVLKEAASFGQPAEQFSPQSNGAEDYRSLCEWLIENVAIDRPEPDQESDQEPDQEPDQEQIQSAPASPTPSIVTVPSFDSYEGLGSGPEQSLELAAAALVVSAAASSSTPTTAPAAPVAPVVASAITPSEPKSPDPVLSRAAELAIRAKQMAPAPTASSSKTVQAPLRRSMMPHRPVAIEVVDDRVFEPVLNDPIQRVKHLLGVRPVTGGVLFVQPASIGSEIRIAGSFNAWNPAVSQMKHNQELGIYELHCKIPAGSYEYKLVVDGQWVLDPYNLTTIKNGIGSLNNLVRVRA